MLLICSLIMCIGGIGVGVAAMRFREGVDLSPAAESCALIFVLGFCGVVAAALGEVMLRVVGAISGLVQAL